MSKNNMTAATSSHSQFAWIALIAIIVIGFGLRFMYLDRDMRFDESMTVMVYASRELPSVVADYSAPNNHIFHTIWVHLSFHNLGETPPFVRLPAFIAGILMIPLSFQAGRRFFDETTGILTAALIAVQPVIVDFGVNARGYTIFACIVLAMLYLGHHLQRHDDTRQWLLFGVLAALGFYTVPVMLYPMGAIGLWMLVSIIYYNRGGHRQKLLINFVVSMVLGAVLTLVFYFPVFWLRGVDALLGNRTVSPLPADEYYAQLGDVFFRIWDHFTWGMPMMMAGVFTLLLILGIFVHRQKARLSLSLVPFFVIWIVPLLLIQRVNPFRRVWFFLVPIALMILASGVTYLMERYKLQHTTFLPVTLIVILFGMSAYITESRVVANSLQTLRVPEAEQGAFYLAEMMTANDVIVMQRPSSYIVFYYMMINDLYLYRDDVETFASMPDDTPAYAYFFYEWHTIEREGVLPLALREVPDAFLNSEQIHEWQYAIVRRGLINPD